MQSAGKSPTDAAEYSIALDDGPSRPAPISRREAIGRSAIATAGMAAWAVPEILFAKPARGATLSAPAVDRLFQRGQRFE